MATPPLTPEVIARFWTKVAKSDGCWEWQAGRNRGGYGEFQIGRRPWPTHRVSFAIANGPIPDGLWVLHSCDNPPCVNPAHLRLGTPKDNGADKTARDRANHHPEYLISISSVSVALGVSKAALRQAIYRGRLKGIRLGEWHFKRSEVERYRAESLGRPGRRHAATPSARRS
jgi:hypothetical protein